MQTVNYAWKINGIWNLEWVDPAWEIGGASVGSYAALAVDSARYSPYELYG